jgi:Fe-S cluster assembly ATPase SufC
MLKINNLHAKIEDGVEILKGINLEIKPGEFTRLWDQMVQENLHFLL